MTAYARTAALVWLKDIADSEVGFRDQYTPEEERKLAASALQIIEEQEERNKVYVVWGTDKRTGDIVFEAAKAAGQTPRAYLAEAIYMRLLSDGFQCDEDLFFFGEHQPTWKL